MSIAETLCVRLDPVPTGRTVCDSAAEPSMEPVTVDNCFGWLHAKPAALASDTAVLICQGLAHDRLCAHRSLRQFADVLAANDYPTLRFDYPDIGDAADLGEVEHWSVWQHSVATAADWLRGHTGARRVVFVGVRVGAMLAALVAERRDDVAALLLLDPVLRGNSYIRQLSFPLRMHGAPPPDGNGRRDLPGLCLSNETVGIICQETMRAIRPPPGCPVAVYSPSPSPVLTAFIDAWRDLGAAVVSEDFAGLTPLLRPTFMNHERRADFARPLAWLREYVPPTPTSLPLLLAPAPSFAPLRGEHWIEAPYRFGGGKRLFGILCRPCAGPQPDRIVLIVNTSASPHCGDNRQAVGFARRLAQEGIATLRMDFAGIGDSQSPGTDREAPTHILETDRTGDISAALDALQADGFRHFAVEGLCTGAYHALYGTLADERLSAVMLINLPMFTWRKGDLIELMNVSSSKELLRQLAEPTTWTRLLQGRIDLGASLNRLRTTIVWWADVAVRRAASLLGRMPPASFARQAMETLSRRGVPTQFLFASEDVGIEMFEREFGKGGCGLRGVELHVARGLDHSLSRGEMPQIAADYMVTFLKRNWRA
jgi:pimeloyl-ACP methyl ester carboxylesterase